MCSKGTEGRRTGLDIDKIELLTVTNNLFQDESQTIAVRGSFHERQWWQILIKSPRILSQTSVAVGDGMSGTISPSHSSGLWRESGAGWI
ncbi:hypothetical protein M0R45_021969 [Rubus argutus]|uniref:Uncharacterized protein n=1 Tax=Rubus argutus TaxID=59490 RepID=A0AAW1XEL5_RUBAR